MGPETWMRIPQWVDAKRVQLEHRVDQRSDLNDVIHDVLVAEHQGVDTADDLPDQKAALRTLLSKELRRECFSAQREADNEFLARVRSNSPITDTERSSLTYLEFLSAHVTKSQILRAIQSLRATSSDAA
jgi:hypothetical protein